MFVWKSFDKQLLIWCSYSKSNESFHSTPRSCIRFHCTVYLPVDEVESTCLNTCNLFCLGFVGTFSKYCADQCIVYQCINWGTLIWSRYVHSASVRHWVWCLARPGLLSWWQPRLSAALIGHSSQFGHGVNPSLELEQGQCFLIYLSIRDARDPSDFMIMEKAPIIRESLCRVTLKWQRTSHLS